MWISSTVLLLICCVSGVYSSANILEDCAFANEIINSYYPGTRSAFIGSNTVDVIDGSDIIIGDVIMIIQMQGGLIDDSNTADYGGTDGSGRGFLKSLSGMYEFNVVDDVTFQYGATYTLSLDYPLENDYTSSNENTFQVVKVPLCNNALLIGDILPIPWNGMIGGIVSILSFNIEVQGTVNVTAAGFRGGIDPYPQIIGSGGIRLNFVDNTGSLYSVPYSSNSFNARKGEGFIGSPEYDGSISTYPNGDSARGAPGNAGGGGSTSDAGGGGGGNGGDGGIGGFFSVSPGGFGGVSCPFDSFHIFMGGGGGAGHYNTQRPPEVCRGMNGGGIIYIHAKLSADVSGQIAASGEDGDSQPGVIDGRGGGGAGGTVVLLCDTDDGSLFSGTSIDLGGGDGNGAQVAHGGGGGGGGGALLTTTGFLSSVDISGGNAGSGGSVPAEPGIVGTVNTGLDSTIFSSEKIFSDVTTISPTPSNSPSINFSNTASPSFSSSISISRTISSSTSLISQDSSSSSNSNTPSRTVSDSSSPTKTTTRSSSPSKSSSTSSSISISISTSSTKSISISRIPTRSNSQSNTASVSSSSTSSITESTSPSPSKSSSSSISQTKTMSQTLSSSISLSPSVSSSTTNSSSNTLSATVSPTKTPSNSGSVTITKSISFSNSQSLSSSISRTMSQSISDSISSSLSISSSSSPLISIELEIEDIGPSTLMSITPSSSTSESHSPTISLSRFFENIEAQNINVNSNLGCIQCVVENINVVIDTTIENQEISMLSSDNTFLGTITFPKDLLDENIQFSVNIEVITNFISFDEELGNTIIDITMFNSDGEIITEFDDKIEICIAEEADVDKDKSCLGFFDVDTNEWKCEDKCLQEENENEYCGETDHFTSFALLLNGNSNGDGCGETNLDTVILWLSLAAVGLALIAICIGLILVEIRIRYNNLQKEKEFMKIEDRIQENSNTN